MNLIAIAHGWYNYIQGSPEVKQMMAERLSICDTCQYKEELSPAGKLLVRSINKKGSIFRCGQCKCPLAGKTANPNQECPLRKWSVFKLPETYY